MMASERVIQKEDFNLWLCKPRFFGDLVELELLYGRMPYAKMEGLSGDLKYVVYGPDAQRLDAAIVRGRDILRFRAGGKGAYTATVRMVPFIFSQAKDDGRPAPGKVIEDVDDTAAFYRTAKCVLMLDGHSPYKPAPPEGGLDISLESAGDRRGNGMIMKVSYDMSGIGNLPIIALYGKPVKEMELTTAVDGTLEIPSKLKGEFRISASHKAKRVNENGKSVTSIHYTTMMFRADQ